jgi:hypothetical protein
VYCGGVLAPPQTLVFLGAVLVLGFLTEARPARAQEAAGFAFSWQAPVGCPNTGEVRAEIARLLGGTIGVVPGGGLQARAVVTHAATWAVALETTSAGQAGQRSLEAGSCRELANATALIIALMIDPDAVAAHAPPPAPPLPASAPSPPASEPARTLDAHVGIIIAGTQGTLPSPDVGVGASVGLSGRRWRIDLRASYGLRRDQTATASFPPGGHGQFNFFSTLLAGCWNLGGPGVAWGPCAVGEFGVMSAKGIGVDRALPAQVPWWAVGAGGFAAIPLARRWAVPIHLDALVPLHRSEYVFRDSQGNVSARVFRAAPVGVRVSAGIELRF